MSFFKKMFGLEEEYEEEYYEEEEPSYIQEPSYKQEEEYSRVTKKQNVVSIESAPSKQGSGAKVILMEPKEYREAQQVADHLLGKRAVVVNLQKAETHVAKRIIDFLSGTTYSINGDIKKIGANTFLCTSDNVDISGQISELHMEYQNNSRSW